MTRINVVDPIKLTDQHLMAEYRELPMVMGALRRSLASKNRARFNAAQQNAYIPSRYTLNAGHVTFFYNKGAFLRKRYALLIEHLKERGFVLDPNRKADFSVFDTPGFNLNNDWTPDEAAIDVNTQRLYQRIAQKPSWYRYFGQRINKDSLWFLHQNDTKPGFGGLLESLK